MQDPGQYHKIVRYTIEIKSINYRNSENMEYYKSWRIIDGKPRWVIVNKNGDIINRNPCKDELKRLTHLEEEKYKQDLEKSREYKRNWSMKKGSEYRNNLARKNGYKNFNDYQLNLLHNKGKNIPMSINKDCSAYLGVHIAERLLPYIFESPRMMPYGNPGFDVICKNEFKIDIKSACIGEEDAWRFPVRYNKIANYFMFIGFNNRKDLNVLFILLINGDELIYGNEMIGRKLNNRVNFSVSKRRLKLGLKKYNLIDKIDKANDICNKLKNCGDM